MRFRNWAIGLVPLLAFVALLSRNLSLAGLVAAAAQLLVGYTLLAWMLDWLNRAVEVRFLANRKGALGILGDHQISISSEGMVETTAVSENRYRWAGVPRIERTATHLFLWMNDISAHIVPLSAFPSAAAASEFELRAQEHKAASTLAGDARPFFEKAL
jgi:hypothetical protein